MKTVSEILYITVAVCGYLIILCASVWLTFLLGMLILHIAIETVFLLPYLVAAVAMVVIFMYFWKRQ